MRALITGAGGQLGTDLADHCRTSGDDVSALTRSGLDVSRRDQVLGVIADVAPDVVFHAAAWTAVDDCESDPERAFRDNALAARWVAEAASRVGAHLIHVSTDYVFDGTKDQAYTEWDEPRPTSVYGASKLAGEREVRSIAPDCAVVRTSWVMGVHGTNMLKTVLALRDRDRLAFVDDQRGCPSFTADLAVGLRHLAERRHAGTFHLTNAGETTWYGLVREILELAGEDPDKVSPISTAELDPPRPAPRPANSVLGDLAWRTAQLPPMPLYRDSLRVAVEGLLHHSRTEEL